MTTFVLFEKNYVDNLSIDKMINEKFEKHFKKKIKIEKKYKISNDN